MSGPEAVATGAADVGRRIAATERGDGSPSLGGGTEDRTLVRLVPGIAVSGALAGLIWWWRRR
jgi:hypothetical protein